MECNKRVQAKHAECREEGINGVFGLFEKKTQCPPFDGSRLLLSATLDRSTLIGWRFCCNVNRFHFIAMTIGREKLAARDIHSYRSQFSAMGCKYEVLHAAA